MRGGGRFSSLCLASALVAIGELRDAEARCVNTTTGVEVTSGTGQPTSNQTVVCDTAAPNPTAASTVITAAAGSTNVSVTVLPGSIMASTARAIGVENNSTVLNQGQVRTSGLNAFGISTTGNGSTLTNQGTVVTTGSRGFGLDARGSNSTLINSGTINVSGANAAGIRSTETTAGTVIMNSGTITVTGTGASPDFAAGVLFQAGAAGTFVNQAGGIVSSATDSGVRGANANITIRNAGTISGGNGIAINLGNGNDIIQVTGGQINGAIVTGTGNDQFTMSGGTITGNVNLGGGSNILTMTGGQINGSIALGAGNDTVQLFTGATITGSLDGGGGTNALTLDGTGAASLSNTISNFQTLTKQNTGTWDVTSSISGATAVAVTGGTLILSGNNTYTGGTTISAGTLQLGNGGTTGSIVGNVTNNGVLAFNRSDTSTFGGVISGIGSVSQIGTGTTILTGDNAYTGGTSIAAGTLQLGNGGTSGSIVGNVTNNGVLAFNRSDTSTFGGVISGIGSVSQIGTGTTILTGDNAYTGGTSIAAGTLQLGNGGTSGSIVGNVTNNGVLAFNRSDTSTFGGVISGIGSVSQIGTGTTILTGDNAYTGGTSIAAGTLQLGNGGTSGSIVGNVTNNGVLAFNRSDTSTFGGVISGIGSVSQIGTGTTILTAVSTYTGGTSIAAGTLQLGNGGTSGSIVGNVTNNGVLAFNRSDTSTFGGVISGIGSVSQIGTGTTILTAVSTYTGGTTVSAGALAVGDPTTPSAALTGGGNVSIAAGATLGGYGSVTGAVTNNGTIAAANALAGFAGGPNGNFTIIGSLLNAGVVNLAGNGVGNQLTVVGNYTGANGLLNVRTVVAGDGSPSDKLVVSTGTATGTTGIRATNAGGTGALTTGDGILLVQATNGTTTAPTAFRLTGPVSAGAFDYFLFRGGVSQGSQNSWFLRSSVPPAPPPPPSPDLPPVPPPTPAPGTPPLPPSPAAGAAPIPLLRPEVAVQSVVHPVARALALVTLGTFNERHGDQLLLRDGVKVGAWGRVFGQQTREHFAQGARPDFDGTYAGFQAGADLWRFESMNGHSDHMGFYVAQARASGAVHGSVDGFEGAAAGHVDLDASSYGGYWTHLGPSNWYIDAVLQGTHIVASADSIRSVSNNVTGRGFAASIEAGYPIMLVPWLTFEPQIQGIWQRVSFDNTLDQFSTITFDRADVFTGRAGTLLRGTFGSAGALWQPYLKGNVWWGSNGFDTVTFATNGIPTGRNGGTTVEGGGGVTGKLTRNISVYTDASYLSSVSGETRITIKGNAGLRVTW